MEENEQENTAGADADETATPADEPKTCANCGTRIDTTEWHPVVTRTDADGNFRVYAFCDTGCRDEWLDDTSTDTPGES